MNELPWLCSACGLENMVDFGNLSVWPLDKILNAKGFVCRGCGSREAILYSTSSLEEAMRKLMRYPPEHKQFRILLIKCIRKAEGLRLRGETDGAFQRPDMAPA